MLPLNMSEMFNHVFCRGNSKTVNSLEMRDLEMERKKTLSQMIDLLNEFRQFLIGSY